MIRWCARRPAIVWAASAAIVLAGAMAFLRLPLATRGAVELPRLQITARWPGASPEMVEMSEASVAPDISMFLPL